MSAKLEELTKLRLVTNNKQQTLLLEGKQGFVDENTLASYCENCFGTGWQRKYYADGGYRMIKCLNDIHLIDKLLKVGIPDGYKRYSFFNYLPKNPKQQQAKEIAEKFVASLLSQEQGCNRPKGLLLTGYQQTGKTHLAVGIIKALLAEGQLSIKYGDFFDEIFGLLSDQELFNLDPSIYPLPTGDEADLERKRGIFLYNEMLKADLVVLDDLTSECSDLELSVFSHIIAHRYNKYLPVIITTSLSLANIESFLPCSTYSKLIEMCELVSLS
jgi:DNA replication protein DnaC